MKQFFVAPEQVDFASQIIRIEGQDAHHIANVLRMKQGELLAVSDGEQYQYQTRIRSGNAEGIELDIVAVEKMKEPSKSHPTIRFSLYQGIPKGQKMDWIVQKCTEMGVDLIQPVITEHTVVRFQNEKDTRKKQERWQRIAESAAKQSKRGIIPTIHPPIHFYDVFERSDHSMLFSNDTLSVLAHENEKQVRLKQILADCSRAHIDRICAWIGPEGGFSEKEAKQAFNHGIPPVGLGPRILRAETAGLVLLSMIMYDFDLLG